MNADSDLQNRRNEASAAGIVEGRKGTIAIALVIIGTGVFLLLNQLDIFPPRFVFYFWPVILVLAGLVQILVGRGIERLRGIGLILAGVFIELHKLGIPHFGLQDLWPLFIIAAGAALLRNTLREKAGGASSAGLTASEFNAVYIFSGADRKVDSKNFRGGKITAVFGGFKIDLTRSDLEGDQVAIEINAMFGGGEIIVPETWAVVVD